MRLSRLLFLFSVLFLFSGAAKAQTGGTVVSFDGTNLCYADQQSQVRCVSVGPGIPSGGSNTYTTSVIASTSDQGRLVVMNCVSACSYTLPATPPSSSFQTTVVSIGSTVSTVLLPAGATWNNGTVAPVLTTNQFQPVYADTGNSGNYYGTTFGVVTFPSFTGDASGTYNANQVTKLHFGGTQISLSALTSGQCLQYNGSSISSVSCWGTGGNPPGGLDTQVQINKGGGFGGLTGFGVDSSSSPTQLDVPWAHLHLGATNYADLNASALTAPRIFSFPDTAGTFCISGASQVGCGTGTPGGLDTQIQINKSGLFGGLTGFGLDSSTAPTRLSVPWAHLRLGSPNYADLDASALTTQRSFAFPDSSGTICVSGASTLGCGTPLSLPFSATSGAFSVTFAGSPTANRTLSLPDATGTICILTTCGTVWPVGSAGIPNYNGANAWGTTYNASNTIPANFIPTLNQNTTGSAAKWTTARSLAGNSVDGSADVPFANKFVVQGTVDAGLSNAQFLGALGTGIVKNTTSTGVLSIAVAGDFPTLNQNTTGSAAKWTTARLLAGNSTDGSADVPFANKFIVQGTTDSGLSGAQFMGALGTGIVKNTTSTGVLSIAVAGDFPTLNQNTTGTAGGLTGSPAITVSSVTDTGLTAGNCVQASTGGLLTTTASACGSSGGSVTATGTPASGNLTEFSGATSITNGNLSGDVTTSGTLATTVGKLENISLPTLAASTGYLYDSAGTLSLSTSASNFTTGTLPHAQLPTLLSGDIPNNAANTTGSAASLSISGQTGLLTFTGLTTVNRTLTVRDAADTLLELGGSYTPTGTWNWTSASVTWPTFNQNTTGSAGSVVNAVTFDNSGAGAVSGTTFNGSAAKTISYNTIGAAAAGAATTVNSQTCALGSTCTIPFQTNSVNNTSQAGVNLLTSTVNSVGLTVTPTNSGTNQEKFEITGAYTGNAATATALAATPTQCTNGIANGVAANGNANCIANLVLSNGTTTSRTLYIPDSDTRLIGYDGTNLKPDKSIDMGGNNLLNIGSSSDTQVLVNVGGNLGAIAGFALDSSVTPTKLSLPFNLDVLGNEILNSGTILPQTAGSSNLGSAALPFGNVYFSGSLVNTNSAPYLWSGIEGTCGAGAAGFDKLCIGGSTTSGYAQNGIRESVNNGAQLRIPQETTGAEAAASGTAPCMDGNGNISTSGCSTVVDGAGTSTANQLAISTATTHQIGYTATFPSGITVPQSQVTGRYWSCESGIGDGFNAIPAQTYPQTFCYNDTGATVTISGIKCYADGGTPTLNASRKSDSAGLLTGAVTCTTSFAAGTQSATTTLAAGDSIVFSFVAGGTAKQTTWVITGTY